MFESWVLRKGFICLAAAAMLAGSGRVPVYAARPESKAEEEWMEESFSEGEISDGPAAPENRKGSSPDAAAFESGEAASDEASTYLAYPGPVSGLRALCAGDRKVRLTWQKAENAGFYIILRMKEGGACRQIGYTAGCSFTDSSADNTGFNYYWVIPYNLSAGNKYAGSLSDYVYASGRYIEQVRNLKASAGAGGSRLTWLPAAGANAYIILSKTGSPMAPYNQAVTVSGTGYTDTAASAGKVTYYWVYGIYQRYGSSIAAGPVSSYAWAYRKDAGKTMTAAQAEAALKKHFIGEYFEGRMSYRDYKYLSVDCVYVSAQKMEFYASLPLGEGAILFATGRIDLSSGEAYIDTDWDMIYEMFDVYIPSEKDSYTVNLNLYR